MPKLAKEPGLFVPRGSARVAVLANPAARRGRAAADIKRVLEQLRLRGVDPLVLDPSSADDALTTALRCVEAGFDRLIAIGGDGIFHIAANAAVGSATVVGVVAAGTGNDAAHALGLAAGSLERRVVRALDDSVPVDLLACSQPGWSKPLHAVTSCIAGFPVTVNLRAEAMLHPRGPVRYTLATLQTISAMKPGRFRLSLRGGTQKDSGACRVLEEPAAVVVVANTGLFGGGMRICPQARPDDGLLDICLVGDVGRLELLRAFPKVRTGAHVDHPKVTMLQATEVQVEALDADPTVRADGESFGSLPITIAVQSGALLVAGATTHPTGRV